MNLRVAVSLSVSLVSLALAACRGSDARSSEQELWSLGGLTYGDPPPDAGLPPEDGGLPLPDAPPPPDGGPHDGGPYDGGPYDGGPHDGGPHDGGPHDDGGLPDPHSAPKIPYDGGTGQRSWWKDTDGIEPELAGCHVEYTAQGCANAAARQFGEYCSADGLVETNPGPGECHDHARDIGHPYVVDCDRWCRNDLAITTDTQSMIRGVAARNGRCQVIGYLPCNGLFVDSARCLCSDGFKGNGETTPPEGYPGD
jgi:hypothetical protein